MRESDGYTKLADVVAVSICDFELWPDSEQGEQGRGLVQVQYAFLELPKLPPHPPASGAELWAWLLVHAPELKEVPKKLPQGPYREPLQLTPARTRPRSTGGPRIS